MCHLTEKMVEWADEYCLPRPIASLSGATTPSSGTPSTPALPSVTSELEDSSPPSPALSDKSQSPVVHLLPDPKRRRLLTRSSETDSENTSSWNIGRGKGGRNMRILRGRLTVEKSKSDLQKEKKLLWKQWLKGYTEEINEIIKNNPRGLHIQCVDCFKNVSKQSYMRHRTINGCAKINPRIKFFNWC